jgi:DNA-binding protein HU-beta
MLKKDLVAAIAKKTGSTKKAAKEALEAFLEVVTEALTTGDSVLLTGFGKFEVRDRAARDGINPKTMEKIRLPATKVPAFKAGKNLKEAVKAS